MKPAGPKSNALPPRTRPVSVPTAGYPTIAQITAHKAAKPGTLFVPDHVFLGPLTFVPLSVGLNSGRICPSTLTKAIPAAGLIIMASARAYSSALSYRVGPCLGTGMVWVGWLECCLTTFALRICLHSGDSVTHFFRVSPAQLTAGYHPPFSEMFKWIV